MSEEVKLIPVAVSAAMGRKMREISEKGEIDAGCKRGRSLTHPTVAALMARGLVKIDNHHKASFTDQGRAWDTAIIKPSKAV